jgi:hypothetical protein
LTGTEQCSLIYEFEFMISADVLEKDDSRAP